MIDEEIVQHLQLFYTDIPRPRRLEDLSKRHYPERLLINPTALEFVQKYEGLVFYALPGEPPKRLALKQWGDFEDVIFDVQGNSWINTCLDEVFEWFDAEETFPWYEGTLGQRIYPVASYLDCHSHSHLFFDVDGDLYRGDLTSIFKIGNGIQDFWRFVLRQEVERLNQDENFGICIGQFFYKGKLNAVLLPLPADSSSSP